MIELFFSEAKVNMQSLASVIVLLAMCFVLSMSIGFLGKHTETMVVQTLPFYAKKDLQVIGLADKK